ncbi:unnamed protein product [Moneuplotes crassus]|uniref:Uncharacterized protein n=1 Tax=Euplotes crassus TaxID=5936 RepID=A0AAD1XWK5_EUPCR|nr:unnamed protein product [Moneuplotes crassus]
MEDQIYENSVLEKEQKAIKGIYEAVFDWIGGWEFLELDNMRWRQVKDLQWEMEAFGRKIRKLGLKYVDECVIRSGGDGKMLKRFMQACFIKRIQQLVVRFWRDKRENSVVYRVLVGKFIPKVDLSLELCDFKISSREFRKIIQVGRTIEEMIFVGCILDLTDLKLSSSLSYYIKKINFLDNYGLADFYFQRSQDNITNLLKAGSVTNMKSSLEMIQTDLCKGIEKLQIIALLLNFTQVSIKI